MKEEDDIRKKLKVIQGKKPTLNYMKNNLPRLFKELRIKLGNVSDLNWLIIEEVKRQIQRYELKYGRHLENIYFEEAETVEKIYSNINQLISELSNIEKIKNASQKNIGKEPGE